MGRDDILSAFHEVEVMNMFCVVGLGNTGSNYSECRHNAGFRALDFISNQLKAPFDSRISSGISAETLVDGEKMFLIKPTTSVNRSGECIKEIVLSLGIPLQKIMVIVDDILLPAGEIRIRSGGSAGSHNGMRSIVQVMESEDFPRIRIGVGSPPDGQSLTDYVLGTPSEEEKEKLEEAFSHCLDAALLVMKGRTAEAQNLFNVKARTRRKEIHDQSQISSRLPLA